MWVRERERERERGGGGGRNAETKMDIVERWDGQIISEVLGMANCNNNNTDMPKKQQQCICNYFWKRKPLGSTFK